MKEKYMKIAVKEAEKALINNEIPVGAVIVYNDKVIAKAHNKKEKTKNSLMHAEIIAINKACKKIGDWRLNECDIYITMEPCYMCMGAIIESRINNIYCGTKNDRSNDTNKYLIKKENINIEYGILSEIINKQLNNFFKKMRSSKNKCS